MGKLHTASLGEPDDGPGGGRGGDPLVMTVGETTFKVGLELGGAAGLIPGGVRALGGTEPGGGFGDGGVGGGPAGAFAEGEEAEAGGVGATREIFVAGEAAVFALGGGEGGGGASDFDGRGIAPLKAQELHGELVVVTSGLGSEPFDGLVEAGGVGFAGGHVAVEGQEPDGEGRAVDIRFFDRAAADAALGESAGGMLASPDEAGDGFEIGR